MEFKEKLQTKNVTKTIFWKPKFMKPEYIMYHHTAWWTYEGNKRVLMWLTSRQVSSHFLIWENWEVAKLSEPEYICWHAWIWSYKFIKDMNKHCIWIEVVWPPFKDIQRKMLKELTLHLMKAYWIPKENVIRHKDYTSRKIDISDELWNSEYKSFEEWKNNKLI